MGDGSRVNQEEEALIELRSIACSCDEMNYSAFLHNFLLPVFTSFVILVFSVAFARSRKKILQIELDYIEDIMIRILTSRN